MMNPEFGTAKEKEHFVAYAHNFERYAVAEDGQSIDVLEQILHHGLLSPRRAKDLGIPLQRRIHVEIVGVDNYDDIIFLFPLRNIDHAPFWPKALSVIYDKSLLVLSAEEMGDLNPGRWVHLSPLNVEVYVFGQVDNEYLRRIKVWHGDVNEVDDLVTNLRPDLKDKLMIN